MAVPPYYPRGLDLPGFHEQVIGMEVILGVFFSVTALVAALTWLAASSLSGRDRGMVVWLVITGIIHVVVEGAFSLNARFYQNENPTMLLLELWKEYSKADSRYATRDTFTTAMETCTAFLVGPMCFAAAYGLLKRCSWRWVLVLVLSTFQLYGDILYFATYWMDEADFSRPEPMYFWFYFVTINGIWVVIPLWCVWVSLQQSMLAVAKVEGSKRTKKL
jgi:cholestenol Delta-isomerase